MQTAVDVQFTPFASSYLPGRRRIAAIFAGDALRYFQPKSEPRAALRRQALIGSNTGGRPSLTSQGRLFTGGRDCLSVRFPSGARSVLSLRTAITIGRTATGDTAVRSPLNLAFGRVVRIAPLLVLATSSTQSFEKTAGNSADTAVLGQSLSRILKLKKQFPESNSGDFSAQGRMSFLF